MKDMHTMERQAWIARENRRDRMVAWAVDTALALLCCAVMLAIYAAGSL